MKCPKCAVEMEKRRSCELELDECPQCKGVWYDRGELKEAKDRADEDVRWVNFELWKDKDRCNVSAQERKCPRCDIRLATIHDHHSDIDIDVCAKCDGVWLDAGEFEKIVKTLDEDANNKTVSEYLRASIREAKDIVLSPGERFISEWKDLTRLLRMLEYRLLAENPKLLEKVLRVQEENPFV